MGWQGGIVLVLVALAAVYVGRRFWRVWTGKATGACHCSSETCAKTAGAPKDPSMSGDKP